MSFTGAQCYVERETVVAGNAACQGRGLGIRLASSAFLASASGAANLILSILSPRCVPFQDPLVDQALDACLEGSERSESSSFVHFWISKKLGCCGVRT